MQLASDVRNSATHPHFNVVSEAQHTRRLKTRVKIADEATYRVERGNKRANSDYLCFRLHIGCGSQCLFLDEKGKGGGLAKSQV